MISKSVLCDTNKRSRMLWSFILAQLNFDMKLSVFFFFFLRIPFGNNLSPQMPLPPQKKKNCKGYAVFIPFLFEKEDNGRKYG